ncbi:MAG TPA: dihydrofolate reductase family protein [Gemmatimonadaceae bacterium]|nr:dihydrofolate reductase family protein [Gemmatimonadaceae bacterium]
MPKLRLWITMSLDGFVAGPNQSASDPLGVGGMRLHEWAFALAQWREAHGMSGGATNESSRVVEEATAGVGATIMGRNMFGGHPGAWSATDPWMGWWGEDPPYHHPVFVVTHHPRETLVLEGDNSFTFVTDGIESALEQARRAAGEKDISLAGGASISQQYLAAGLVDQMDLNVAPILLGDGERLFDGVSDLHGLQLVRTIAMPNVTHYRFMRA